MKKSESQDFDLILYSSPDGNTKVSVRFEDESFWLAQRRIAELFEVDVRTVNEHLKNIYASGELAEDRTIRNFRIVQREGTRDVKSLRLTPRFRRSIKSFANELRSREWNLQTVINCNALRI